MEIKMKSNLSKRVEKAKGLAFSHSHYEPALWSTWGSRDSEYGEKYYRITLSHQKETVNTPDGPKNILVFIADCQKDTGNGKPCNCPGNERYTVCYHSLGAIYRSFEQAKRKMLVSFFETYESAVKMAFSGTVAKIKSANGPGVVWCTLKDWPKKPETTFEENVNLMRGSVEENEGID